MKNVHAVLLLLTVGITTVHSFQCYECFTKVPDVNYTTEQCLTEQVKVECTSDKTCVRYYSEESGRDQLESRACVSKDQCRVFEEYCANDTRKEEDGTTVCQVNCCVSDGDTPCNGESDSGNNSNDNNNNNNNSTLKNNNNNNNNNSNSNSALVVSTNRMVEMLTMMALLATDLCC